MFIWRFLLAVLVQLICDPGCNGFTAQEMVDYLASNLRVEYAVLDNNPVGELSNQWRGHMDLTNTGNEEVHEDTWEIYFCSVRLLEYDTLRYSIEEGVELGDSGIEVYHVDGCLHKLVPLDTFEGFLPNKRIQLPFMAADWSVSRTDFMPKWYVDSTEISTTPKTITSTVSESLDLVSDFVRPEQWKRRPADDLYNPFTPKDRLDNTGVEDAGEAKKPIIPTPVAYTPTGEESIRLDTGDWVVIYVDDYIKKEAEYLADKMNTVALSEAYRPSSRYVQVEEGGVDPPDNTEAYVMEVSGNNETVRIIGNAASGVFYGIQSFLSLASVDAVIQECHVLDYPRFPYRGMHIDVARNFHPKEDILKLLDVMSMYKLNKLHFHLTDDEGWRLEIPGLPELTQVGARRCHDLEEMQCLLPQLGSGPTFTTSGSGFYSVADYKEILQYANDRHIEVIPEFDMPGHAHAAIRAMEARAANGSTEYRLADPADKSDYFSVQMYRHNAINPCLDTTYNFISKVIEEVQNIHKDIQPLRYFNYGGDETPDGAWINSTFCAQFTEDNDIEKSRDAIKEEFAKHVSELVEGKDLHFAAWEDGIMEGLDPYNRSQFPNENVLGYAWNNIWEWGSGNRAYLLANAGFQVVLSHATHLYFDHPHEPDPEERGYYWATRYTDARKTFNYMPDDVYKNIDVTNFGESLEGYCDDNECVPLDEDKRHNVLGMQGHLWSETVRTSEQLDSMIYPRLLAIAERAWHKATWESNDKAQPSQDEDWHDYANTLGYKELKRLDDMGVRYGIPPLGASFHDDGSLELSTMYPGLAIQYSVDGGNTWSDYSQPVTFEPNIEITAVVRSSDRSRTSRPIILQSPEVSAANTMKTTLLHRLFVCCFVIFKTVMVKFC